MGNVINKNEEEKLQKYDYIRAEYFGNGKKLPYKPRPLTNYEKDILRVLGDTLMDNNAKTYADLDLKELIMLTIIHDYPMYESFFKKLKEELLSHKGKNFSKYDVTDILHSLELAFSVDFSGTMDKLMKLNIFRKVEKEEDSILSYLSNSDYYNEHKNEFSDLKNYYFKAGDFLFFYKTLFELMPEYAKEEIENRKNFLSGKKAQDESDFLEMRKKMIELYEAGDFKKGDELLLYYTYHGDRRLNGVARGTLTLKFPSKLDMNDLLSEYEKLSLGRIIDKDLFVKTVLELVELRNRLKKSNDVGNIPKDRWSTVNHLYRGLPLKDFLKTIQGAKAPKDWLNKETFEEELNDDVIKYLTGKTSMDPAVLSTSLYPGTAETFAKLSEATGVVLDIDMTNYHKGINLADKSHFRHEQEVLLPAKTKLKIKSVSFKRRAIYYSFGLDSYFAIDCVPI